MMDKTIKINLAGILFQIDEAAFHILRDYLKSIDNRFKNVPGGNETIDDIEARIAEIFQSQRGLSGIISKENVDAMVGIIGKPEDFEQVERGSESAGFSSHRRRLYRNPDDSIISGVCGGIGAYLNIDPVWIRLLFILFTISFGLGFFVYIALWIALPNATGELQKRELYGENYITMSYQKKQDQRSTSDGATVYNRGNEKVNNAGNVFNEIFRAIGKFFYIFFRIILIIIGVSFVLAGFATLLAFLMTFFFRYPGYFFGESIDTSMFYLPDFLDFFINPALTPWVMALTSVIVILPLLALVYWGLKMTFWFRVKDWIVSMVALIIWVLSISAMVMLLFSEGISFAETGKKNDQIILETPRDTLYLKVDKKISDLKFDKEISLPGDDYSLFINETTRELFSRPEINLMTSEDGFTRIDVERYSHGKTRREAVKKAESLIYNYRISNDTIYVDEYYKIPTEYKWTGAWVDVDISVPEGTVIWFDKKSEDIFNGRVVNRVYSRELGGKY
ncbi:MAG: hypothetical protein C0408_03225 [Odoribacter sp.]|nr:hypothetical protein [Odoribacter sp.]